MPAPADIERLRPAVDEITAMMKMVKPFSPDYCILLGARTALKDVADHFTGEPFVFGSKGTSSTGLG